MATPQLLPIERIAARIYRIRDESVMLDADLAELYGVQTRVLNQAVNRNLERFPDDFLFRLSWEEFDSLRSQNVILKTEPASGRGRHRKHPPLAFTEHGIAMLSSVLRSKTAVQVNIAIMRTFVRIRRVLATHEDLARKVAQHDEEIGALFAHVRRLLNPPESPAKRRIGFPGA